jgi:hypothetical protein
VASRKPGQSKASHYNKFQVDGIDIYTHRDLIQLSHNVELGMGGFWIFKNLYAAGLGSPAACSF